MKELSTELKNLHENTLNNLKNAKAKNTLRAYKSDFNHFSLFCARNNISSLPADPKHVSLYLTKISKELKMSTIKRRLVSISLAHKLKGLYLDTKHPIIVENLMGIKRNIGNYQKSKKPLLINNLKLIINYINKYIVNYNVQSRDKALILIGFSGGFRRSELISIDYEDLDFTHEGLKIRVKRSKTDQFGEGMIKGIPYFQNSDFCPILNLQNWLQISAIKSGPIFRKFKKNLALTTERLSSQTVALIIKKYLHLAGIDNTNFAGHSLRSGFASVAAESGADERNIMAMTGHKSTQMVRRYIKEANIFKNNALNNIKL